MTNDFLLLLAQNIFALAPATMTIIIITVLFSIKGFSNPVFYDNMMMNPYLVRTKNQYYRFITSGFIHADIGHIFFNMFTLYIFGRHIEYLVFNGKFGTNYYLGSILFVLFYFSAIIISDLYAFFKNRFNPSYRSLGASGAVSAIVFMLIMFNPMARLGILFLPFHIPAFIFGLLYLIYSIFMSRYGSDNIGHEAHLFGALYGIIISITIEPNVVAHFLNQISRWKGFF